MSAWLIVKLKRGVVFGLMKYWYWLYSVRRLDARRIVEAVAGTCTNPVGHPSSLL
jgi:hypothetical protein